MITWYDFDLLMQDWKYSHMSIAVMHSGRFGNVHELRFETARSYDMGCATLLEGRFVDASKSSFQGAKNSNICSKYVE